MEGHKKASVVLLALPGSDKPRGAATGREIIKTNPNTFPLRLYHIQSNQHQVTTIPIREDECQAQESYEEPEEGRTGTSVSRACFTLCSQSPHRNMKSYTTTEAELRGKIL